uniref:Uncharacterized protein n=1 Tax=Cacopsylla melanoneura TaxID=428564 RepID=A0A8D8XV33_9HEMI
MGEMLIQGNGSPVCLPYTLPSNGKTRSWSNIYSRFPSSLSMLILKPLLASHRTRSVTMMRLEPCWRRLGQTSCRMLRMNMTCPWMRRVTRRMRKRFQDFHFKKQVN